MSNILDTLMTKHYDSLLGNGANDEKTCISWKAVCLQMMGFVILRRSFKEPKAKS